MLRRRYREFSELHRALAEDFRLQGPPLPPLPSKRIFGSSTSPAFVQDRRLALQGYLRKLCASPEFWQSDALVRFLDADTSMLRMQMRVAGARREWYQLALKGINKNRSRFDLFLPTFT
ncbi:Phox homologous domain-containing protein [Tribonema minus]|uniref:Phox homologous domain-containing protein n=1 Tax=Tribonema minus TaxID=303371 RepID=A0A835ZDW8_9STRA|nr:Phox homologous domain-containing protein [Tribonema minus]